MIKLVIFAIMFFPSWDKDTNPSAKADLSRLTVEKYQTMSKCKEAETRFADTEGIYQKVYPYKDRYRIAIKARCIREKRKI